MEKSFKKSEKKLLVITQAVDKNDQALAFFLDWLNEFSKRFESVLVICLKKGEYTLSENVKVLSLGKEEGGNLVVQKFRYIFHFYKYIWQERNNYDIVFVHMNQIYVLLAGWFFLLQKKFLAFWYVHRQVTFSLLLATPFPNIIFTATPESYKIPTDKRVFVGQGIKLEKFARTNLQTPGGQSHVPRPPGVCRLLSVGRITAIKNLDILLDAVKILNNQNIPLDVSIVGDTVMPGDKEVKKSLLKQIDNLYLRDVVKFLGNIPNDQIASEYWAADLSINLTPTGGTDKSVLESLAAETPTIVSNTALKEVLGKYSGELIFKERDAKDLAEKILKYLNKSEAEKSEIKKYLLDSVRQHSSLSHLHDIIFKNIVNNL